MPCSWLLVCLAGVRPAELIELLRAERSQVLPFVGSGMTIAAGAPRAPALALELARRSGVSLPPGASRCLLRPAAARSVL
jgi:hypothetical protein